MQGGATVAQHTVNVMVVGSNPTPAVADRMGSMREWQARLTVNQVVYPVEVRVLPALLAQRCRVELLRDRKVTGSSPVISLWEM